MPAVSSASSCGTVRLLGPSVHTMCVFLGVAAVVGGAMTVLKSCQPAEVCAAR
jgi:hypothetical protein